MILWALAFYNAWNLGANDVANSMGTVVGAKSLKFGQAIALAGVLEFGGAFFLGNRVTGTLATQVANPQVFAANPMPLILGMVAVMVATTLWLQLATRWGLPVASSHGVVGAIAGFMVVAQGGQGLAWSQLELISLAWGITPLVSGAVAGGLFWLLRRGLAAHTHKHVSPEVGRLGEWLPWISGGTIALFGVLLWPSLVPALHHRGLTWGQSRLLLMGVGLGSSGLLTAIAMGQWHRFRCQEQVFRPFQILSAGFVALGHGANDVGNAIAPLVVIDFWQHSGTLPLGPVTIPGYILAIGGVGLVAGLGFQGGAVIHTIGDRLMPLTPTIGFLAELATAVTILAASHLGLPVSTSHGLVGSVVGLGLIMGEPLPWPELRKILVAWVLTVPLCGLLSAIAFWILCHCLPFFPGTGALSGGL